VQRLNQENGITLTTVGIGSDAAAFLPDLAELGGGRYHFAANPGAIPSIFSEETLLATRSYIIEEQFYPKVLHPSPILEGIQVTPPLYGYVGTSPKDSAQTILVTHKDDPLLAAWQYGLGKVVAFTSDATSRWAKDWVKWPEFANFWANTVRYTIGEVIASSWSTQVQLEGEQAVLTADTAGNQPSESNADYLNGYAMQANVVNPDGQSHAVALSQVAPGRYEGSFTPGKEGVYLLRITGQPPTSEETPIAITSGWVYAYSAEYRQLEADPDALYRISLAGGGKVADSDPASAFEHNLPAAGASRPLWKWLLLVATLLLPVDIGIRRLVIQMSDLQRGWNAVASQFKRVKPAPAALAPRSDRIEGLMRAKQAQPHRQESISQRAAKEKRPVVLPSQTIVQERPAGQAHETNLQIDSGKLEPASTVEDKQNPQTTAAALLAKKKERK
jgi:hypothetical protein